MADYPYRLIVMDPPWPERGGGKIKRGADRHYDVYGLNDIVGILYSFEDEDGDPLYRPDPEGCQVWIWTTMNKLPMAFDLIEQLELTYITHRIWVKAERLEDMVSKMLGYIGGSDLFPKKAVAWLQRAVDRGIWTLQRFGLGQYIRGAHEIAILASNIHGDDELVYSMLEDHEVALLCRTGRTKTHCRKVPSVLLAPKTEQHSEKPEEFYVDAMRISGGGPALELFARDRRPGWDASGNELDTNWREKEK